MLDEFIHEPRTAYFSMEIALRNEIPDYAGGLGMLADDTMRSATELGPPMVAVSLISCAGFFSPGNQCRWQTTGTCGDLGSAALGLAARRIAVHIGGRTVWIHADCCIPDDVIWQAHVRAKLLLIGKVQALTGVVLQPDIPVFGFARRMTAYKCPDFLFSDIERLQKIAQKYPFQRFNKKNQVKM